MSLGQPPSDQAVVNLRGQQSIVTPHLVSGVGSFHNVNTELINGLPVGNRYGYLPYYFRQAATASGSGPLFTLDVGVNTIGWDKLVSPNLLVQSNGIPEILESPAPNAPWTARASTGWFPTSQPSYCPSSSLLA